MSSDSHFFIGKSHEVCEDYALHGLTDDEEHCYAIVSDGCSSSDDTDFGSRILCKAAQSAICLLQSGESKLPMVRPLDHVSNISNAIAANVLSSFGRMLTNYSLDCSLMVAYQHDDAFHVIATGDGVVVAKRNDGKLETHVIEYAGNAPVYLNYINDADRLAGLYKNYDCTKRIYSLTDDGQDTQISDRIEEYFEFPFGEYSEVAVMTDGVLSYRRPTEDEKEYERVPIYQIVEHIMGFKGRSLGFMKNHVKKFMFDCSLLHTFNSDDVAVGVVTK